MGETGDIERDTRKVVVSGERSGLTGRALCDDRRAFANDGSTGKSKCRVSEPAAMHHQCDRDTPQDKTNRPLVPAIIANTAVASLNTPSISFTILASFVSASGASS